ncbi:glycoside hydrolase family 78 protein [Saccharicrinis sp. FJH54]|uniref:glycoside hydrolase family 78 protein n=1 Tax=Saccharicrinis sp. FJH54 TaxID=3344665 RepID=UPI0035D45470
MKQIIIIILSLAFLGACNGHEPKIRIVKTECNHFDKPLGVDNQHPEFSWMVESDTINNRQASYQILVADVVGLIKKDSGNIWNSGKVNSTESENIIYSGKELLSGRKYYWKVKVWDIYGNESDWSEMGSWQMGLLKAQDWSGAEWIGYEELPESDRVVEGITGYGDISLQKVEKRSVVPMFRNGFKLKDEVGSATLYISGLGQYEATINGEKVGDAFLTPGWTHYDKTVLYNTYDVTEMLRRGDNAIGVIVGNGFYYNNRERYRKLIIAYGFPELLCKLQVQYKNGESETIVSDSGWKMHQSPITYSGIYGGEDYDARREEKGWNKAGFNADSWLKAKQVSGPSGTLRSDQNYPVKVMQTFDPVSVTPINDSVVVYDFGQNASGIVSLKIRGKAGQEVQLWPGELLKDDGTVNQRGSGSPYYYTYICSGEDKEKWQPRFSYYGFRYVQVNGAQPDAAERGTDLPEIIELKALHTRSATPQVGTFECSSERFNRIFDLIRWSIRSNIQSVMTDCPTREKLGWLEQTHLMGESVHFNYDMYHLYLKLTNDMMDAQTKQGLVPSIVPEYINFEYYDSAFRDSPEWGSASITMPWMVYKWYGDPSVIQKAWPMMKAYMDYLAGKSEDYILSHGLGDWYDIGPNTPGYAQLTPVPLVATATYYYDAVLMSEIAAELQKGAEEQSFKKLAKDINAAFNNRFYNAKSKLYATASQTALAMPLSLGLVPEGDEQAVFENLLLTIHKDNNSLTAGDIGFHYLVDALTRYGASDLLFAMNNRDDVPGYAYQLKKGATALTESWQALDSKSNNHLMLGHLMEWFFQGLGGIGQESSSVGYKAIVIKPDVIDSISYVKTSYESPYGTIKSEWQQDKGSFELTIEIPFNTTATVVLPFNGEVLSEPENCRVVNTNNLFKDKPVYKTGSGRYTFKIRK